MNLIMKYIYYVLLQNSYYLFDKIFLIFQLINRNFGILFYQNSLVTLINHIK